MLSSMARLWPVNFGQLGLAWIVGLLRFLHVTFLKSFPSLAVGREHSDENGNSVRTDEAGSKSVPSASSGAAPVGDEAVSKGSEPRLSRAPAQTDGGSARKGGGGKERKGRVTGRAHGKCKQKVVQKVQRNEVGAECGKNCHTESRKCASESEDASQEQCAEAKNTEEERFEDCDEEILPLEERCEMKDHNKEDDDIGIIGAELTSDNLCQDVRCQSTNGAEFPDSVQSAALPVETVATEAVWPGRNRPRKKRRRAKGSKQDSSVSTPGDRNLTIADNRSRTSGELIGMVDDCPLSRANCILALPSVNSTMFGGSALAKSRQKPSARVHPSRSTSAVDCALTPAEYDLSPESKASLVSPVESEIDAAKSKSQGLFVDLRQNSVNVCSCTEFSEGSAKMSGLDVVTSAQRSYDCGIKDGGEASFCDSVVAESRCFSPTSFCELSRFGRCLSTRTKAQNFVNSHSAFDPAEAKLSHPGLRSVEVMRPGYVEPPRFKPRSLVNPLPAGPTRNATDVVFTVETAAPDVINKPDLIGVQGTATQLIESLVVNSAQRGSGGFGERRSSKFDDEGGFARSDSLSGCRNRAVVNGVCHENNGFHGNRESSRSVAKLIRCRADESRAASSPVRATRLIAHGQTAHARGNHDQGSESLSNPVHRYFRNSGAKETGPFVKKTKDRPPRSLPKSERRAGFRTRSAIREYIRYDELQRIAEMNFNLRRAQKFLHSEYLVIVEKQKQKNCDVMIFTSN